MGVEFKTLKGDIREIKGGIAEIIKQIGEMRVDASELRTRVRTLEKEVFAHDKLFEKRTDELMSLKAFVWKIAGIVSVLSTALGFGASKLF